MNEITGYSLSRDWFDFAFENPDLINPNHHALYFFIIEHWNRMGSKDKFGLPMQMCMEVIGIRNYRTYSKTFADLVQWGFVLLIQKSTNQYSANVVALVKNTKAKSKALYEATQKQSQKQVRGIVGIDKPITKETLEPETEKEIEISPPPKKIKTELDFSIVPPDFLPAVELWLSYKKEKGQPYKPIGFQALITTLKKQFKSGESLLVAVNFSMGKNWDGIFEEKKANGQIHDALPHLRTETADKYSRF